MTVTIGLWAIPVVVTLLGLAWTFLTPSRYAGNYSWDPMPGVRLVFSIFAVLLAVIVWLLLK